MDSPPPNLEIEKHDVPITTVIPNKGTTLVNDIILINDMGRKITKEIKHQEVWNEEMIHSVTANIEDNNIVKENHRVYAERMIDHGIFINFKNRSILIQSRLNYFRRRIPVKLMYLTITKRFSLKWRRLIIMSNIS